MALTRGILSGTLHGVGAGDGDLTAENVPLIHEGAKVSTL